MLQVKIIILIKPSFSINDTLEHNTSINNCSGNKFLLLVDTKPIKLNRILIVIMNGYNHMVITMNGYIHHNIYILNKVKQINI